MPREVSGTKELQPPRAVPTGGGGDAQDFPLASGVNPVAIRACTLTALWYIREVLESGCGIFSRPASHQHPLAIGSHPTQRPLAWGCSAAARARTISC
jgi:hypothetical protein